MSQKSNRKHAVNLSDADIWDDTLLIKRYDESLMLAKEEVARRIAQSTNTDDAHSTAHTNAAAATNAPAHDGGSADIAITDEPYQVGDFVRCTFSEDGIDYEATILSIKGDQYWVRYIGYNNEEAVDGGALIPSWGPEVRDQQMRNAAADTTVAGAGTNNNHHHNNHLLATPSTTTTTTAQKSKKTKQNKDLKTFDRIRAAMMPPPPPLPPMPAGADGDDPDAEGMASMLMAWYMCGYYTGLHQGRKLAQ